MRITAMPAKHKIKKLVVIGVGLIGGSFALALKKARVVKRVVGVGRTRLGVLGMAPAEVDAIEQSGQPRRLVTVVAPRSGVVVNRGVTVGTSVDPSTTLLTIADLSRVWVLAGR